MSDTRDCDAGLRANSSVGCLWAFVWLLVILLCVVDARSEARTEALAQRIKAMEAK